MSAAVLTRFYAPPPICRREILRYSGCKSDEDGLASLIDECIAEAGEVLTYKICCRELPVKINGAICSLQALQLESHSLAQNLYGCEKAIAFAATVGVGIDRLISRYSRLSPAKALIFQALGAERVEALCDTFCADIEREYHIGTKPRFSPGYGDLPLECQKELFALLDCERKIGLTLNDSLLMSPSKSVTAIVGMCSEANKTKNKCSLCTMHSCEFRGAI